VLTPSCLAVVTLLSADTEIIVASVDHPTLRPGDPYEYDKSVVRVISLLYILYIQMLTCYQSARIQFSDEIPAP